MSVWIVKGSEVRGNQRWKESFLKKAWWQHGHLVYNTWRLQDFPYCTDEFNLAQTIA